jgi:hypothetical protein
MLKYLVIPSEILTNSHFVAGDKLILSYFQCLRNNNKPYFGTIKYLADIVGMPEKVVQQRLNRFMEVDLLIKDANGQIICPHDLSFLQIWRPPTKAEDKISYEVSNRLKDLTKIFSLDKKTGTEG